ncbi:putative dehydrin LEA [Cucumis melo var. makuwa]|uniref:Dehydrin LEA n=1 Tax=Cucumis melo var. makuwa TaxID=1194695 RepID=A0A5A7ST54_CUCMM|nr:putative dehydrin LEA [Cucumis melo var. makuwa]TYK22336.1 putative dehydrin LEA [Cucumis melo var. makuwa]
MYGTSVATIRLTDKHGNPIQLTDEHNPVVLTDEHGNPMWLTDIETKVVKSRWFRRWLMATVSCRCSHMRRMKIVALVPPPCLPLQALVR